jgi:rhodanese-related sulfurtransferase
MRLSAIRLFATALIVLSFSGFVASAEESAPTVHPKILTLKEFKDDLPTTAEELHIKEFMALQGKGPVVVLDVRSKESFAKRHLKGSLNAPLTDLTEKTLPGLAPDKNVPVVLACDYSFMPVRTIAMTLQAYPVLKANGYAKIYRLNLWDDRDNKKMIEPAEQEKLLAFEGSDVKAPQ